MLDEVDPLRADRPWVSTRDVDRRATDAEIRPGGIEASCVRPDIEEGEPVRDRDPFLSRDGGEPEACVCREPAAAKRSPPLGRYGVPEHHVIK